LENRIFGIILPHGDDMASTGVNSLWLHAGLSNSVIRLKIA